jgi:hypothetical protein
VERFWAWLGAYRRLSKDFEFGCQHSQSLIYIVSLQRLLKRLAPPTSPVDGSHFAFPASLDFLLASEFLLRHALKQHDLSASETILPVRAR